MVAIVAEYRAHFGNSEQPTLEQFRRSVEPPARDVTGDAPH
jgi:hypothetical protein